MNKNFILINLLPHREEAKRIKKLRLMAFFGLSTTLAVLVLLLMNTVVLSSISNQKMTNEFLVKTNEDLDKEIEEIGKLAEQLKAMLDRKRAVERLSVDKVDAISLLNMLKNIPSGMKLEEVKQIDSKVTIKGTTDSNSSVSELMRILDASSKFKNSRLIKVESASFTQFSSGYVKEEVDVTLSRFSVETEYEKAEISIDVDLELPSDKIVKKIDKKVVKTKE